MNGLYFIQYNLFKEKLYTTSFSDANYSLSNKTTENKALLYLLKGYIWIIRAHKIDKIIPSFIFPTYTFVTFLP